MIRPAEVISPEENVFVSRELSDGPAAFSVKSSAWQGLRGERPGQSVVLIIIQLCLPTPTYQPNTMGPAVPPVEPSLRPVSGCTLLCNFSPSNWGVVAV